MNLKLFKTKLLLLFVQLSFFNSYGQCWQTIKAGGSNTFGIQTDGTLWAWGLNNYGQIGNGSTEYEQNTPLQVGIDNNWNKISIEGSHVLALKTNGTLWAWGSNSFGQLGDGTNVNKNVPIQIGTDNNWIDISAGSYFSIALKSNGTLWSWGGNYGGELGDGTYNSRIIPTQIGTDTNWVSINCGSFHCIAFKSDGTIWTWGTNSYGQLGNGITSNTVNIPTYFGLQSDWLKLALGAFHTLGIKTNGTLWAWGSNIEGQLGYENTQFFNNTPFQVGTSTNWLNVDAGEHHSVATMNNQTLWAWGKNSNGQFGNGTNTNTNYPIQINSDVDWSSLLSLGSNHSTNFKTNNTLWLWGASALGNGTTYSNIPITIDCPSLSIEENIINLIRISPNPSNGMFSILSNENFDTIEIYDALGKNIFMKTNILSKSYSIDVSNYKSKIFIFKVYFKNRVVSEKIILD